MSTIFVRPLNGRHVPMPSGNAVLPDIGANVTDEKYWQRRLSDGDIEIIPAPDPMPSIGVEKYVIEYSSSYDIPENFNGLARTIDGEVYSGDGTNLYSLGVGNAIVAQIKSTNTADQNTANIQTALNNAGNIVINGEANCPINDTFIIKSNTNLILSPGTELVCQNAGDNATFNHFRNLNFSSPKNPITSITAAYSGTQTLATITFTSTPDASVVAGGYLLINNDPSGIYNGIWELQSVNSGAKTATIRLRSPVALPATVGATTTVTGFVSNGTSGVAGTILKVKTSNDHALNQAVNNNNNYLQGTGITANTKITALLTGRGGSGTYTVNNSQATGTDAAPITITVNTELYGIAADANIVISGGTLNSNYVLGGFTTRDPTNDSAAYNDCAIAFNNVLNPVFKDVNFFECRKYRILVASSQNLIVDNIDGNSLADGVKVYGPCFGTPNVSGIHGTMGDDNCSFQTTDLLPTYAGLMPPNSGGSFYNGGIMSNIHGHTGGFNGHAVLYPSGGGSINTGMVMYGTYTIENTGGGFNQLQQDNSNSASGSACVVDSVGIGGHIENVIVRNPHGFIGGGSNNLTGEFTTIDSMLIEHHTSSSNGMNAQIVWYKSKIGRLKIVNSNVFNPGSGQNNNYLNWGDANVIIDALIFDSVKLNNKSITSNFGIGAFALFGSYGGPFVANINTIIIDNCILADRYCYAVSMGDTVIAGTPSIYINDLISLGNYNYALIAAGDNQAMFLSIDGLKHQSGSPFNFYGSGNIEINYKDIDSGTTLFLNAESNLTLRDITPTRVVQRSAPTAGQTVNCTNLNGFNRILIAPAGTLATLTLALPANPINGEALELRSTQAITALTVTNGNIAGITSGVTGLTAGYSRKLIYSAADSLWV